MSSISHVLCHRYFVPWLLWLQAIPRGSWQLSMCLDSFWFSDVFFSCLILSGFPEVCFRFSYILRSRNTRANKNLCKQLIRSRKNNLRMPKEKQKIPVEPTLPAKSHARLYKKKMQIKKMNCNIYACKNDINQCCTQWVSKKTLWYFGTM